MKTNIAFLLVGCLLTGAPLVAAEKSKAKSEVKVAPPEPKDDPSNPDAWQPEISVTSVRTYAELSEAKSAAYGKKSARTSAAYQTKSAAISEVYQKYAVEQHVALKRLRAEDSEAAFYWLEHRVFGPFIDLPEHSTVSVTEPTSQAYLAFKKALREIDKRKDPEIKAIESACDRATKRADDLCDAEIEKVEELFEESKEKS